MASEPFDPVTNPSASFPSSFPSYTSSTFYKSLQASYIISRLDTIIAKLGLKTQVSNSQTQQSSTTPTIREKSSDIGLGVRKHVRIHKYRSKKPSHSRLTLSGYLANNDARDSKPSHPKFLYPINSPAMSSDITKARSQSYSSDHLTLDEDSTATSIRAASVSLRPPLPVTTNVTLSSGPSTVESECQNHILGKSSSPVKLQETLIHPSDMILMDCGSMDHFFLDRLVSYVLHLVRPTLVLEVSFRVVDTSYIAFLPSLPKPPDIQGR